MTDPLAQAGAHGRAARGGALRAGAWTASAALSFISIPLLVRHLGVPEFGRYVAVLAIVNIAALTSDLGLTTIALREWGATEAARRADRIRLLLGLRLTIVTAAALCAIGFAALAGWPARMVEGTAIACAGLYGLVFTDLAIVALAGSLRFRSVAAIDVTRAALGTLAIVALVVADARLTAFFVAWACVMIATATLALRLAFPLVSARPALRGSRALLEELLPFAAASVVHVLYFRAAIVTTSLQAPARQAGLYATVFRVVEFAAAVAGALAGAVTPLLAHTEINERPDFRREALRTVRRMSAAGVVAAVVLGFGAPVIMKLIGGEATEGAVAVMRIQAPALLATFASFGLSTILVVLRLYRQLLVVNAVGFALVVALALWLVPDHGAKGGAVAVLVTEWLIALAQAGVVWRAIGNGPRAALASDR